MMDTKKQEARNFEIIDDLWEKHHDRIQKNREGEYIDFENAMLEREGLSELNSMQSPGMMRTFNGSKGRKKYMMKGFGSGRSRIFRSMG